MRVQRYDRGPIFSFASAEETDEGFLRATTYITRTGVFPYLDAEGNTHFELRHPDDVLDWEALRSFEGKPLTLRHPPEKVTPDNAKQYQVGSIGNDVQPDGSHVTASLTITDAEAIGAARSGEARELSCGYTVSVIDEVGEYEGQPYTKRQTNIRGNHLALVERGRMGPTVSLPRLDSGDAVMVDAAPAKPAPKQTRKDGAPMTTIKIDSVDFPAPEQTAQAVLASFAKRDEALKAAEKNAADAKAETDKVQAQADALAAQVDAEKARADATQAKLDAATSPAVIADAVKARVSLETAARKVLAADTDLDAMDDAAIKRAVIAKRSPDIALDDKSDAYIQAAFDIVVASLKADEQKPAPGLGASRAAADAAKPHADEAAEARKKMIADDMERGRKPLAA